MRDTRETLQHELDEIRNRIDELNGVFEERPGYGLGRGDPAAMRREVDRALLRRLGRRAKELSRNNFALLQPYSWGCAAWSDEVVPIGAYAAPYQVQGSHLFV